MSDLHKADREALESTEPGNTTQLTDALTNTSIFADQRLRRNLGFVAVVCLGWNICNSWAAIAVTMAIGLPQGGLCTILYGIIVTAGAYVCCVGTLAELASVYPTSGGQYHWTSILAPHKVSRALVTLYTTMVRWKLY